MAKTDNREHFRTSHIVDKLLEHIDFGLIILDVDLKVYYWNSWLALQSGISAEEIEGRVLSDFFSNFNEKTLKRKIKTSLSLGRQTFYNASSSKYLLEIKQKKVLHSQFDTPFMQQDVTITPYDQERELVLVKINDQSEISAKNRELAFLNNQLKHEQKIIDTNVYIITIDSDYVVTNLSQAYLELMEFEKEDLLYQNYFEMEQFALSKEEKLFVEESLEARENFYHKQIKLTQSGKKVYLNSHYIPQYDEQGEFVGHMIILQDETASILLQQQQKILLQQSRHAAMGEMISMIAHQWRQPLSVINTILAGIRFDFELGVIDKEELDSSFHKIESTVQFLSSTINDFKDFFRPEKAKRRVKVVSIIEKALTFVAPSMKQKGVEYIYNLACDEELEVVIHANELVQILINIFNNALDAIVANNSQEKVIELTLDANESYFTISIKDSGGGIPQEIEDKIFEPYFSTKSKNGTGLGLYMAKMIIEDHFQGEIFVKSRDGYTTFTLNIPLMQL